MHMSTRILLDSYNSFESSRYYNPFESFRFVSDRARMSGKFYSRKDLQSAKVERRPLIFVRLSFRELCDSELSGLHAFDNMSIIH